MAGTACILNSKGQDLSKFLGHFQDFFLERLVDLKGSSRKKIVLSNFDNKCVHVVRHLLFFSSRLLFLYVLRQIFTNVRSIQNSTSGRRA